MSKVVFLTPKQIELFNKVVNIRKEIGRKFKSGELDCVYFYGVRESDLSMFTDEEIRSLLDAGCIFSGGKQDGVQLYVIDVDYRSKYYNINNTFTTKLNKIQKEITPNSELIFLLNLGTEPLIKNENGEYFVTDGNSFNVSIFNEVDVKYIDGVLSGGGIIYVYAVNFYNPELEYKNTVLITSLTPFVEVPTEQINRIYSQLEGLGACKDTFDVTNYEIKL